MAATTNPSAIKLRTPQEKKLHDQPFLDAEVVSEELLAAAQSLRTVEARLLRRQAELLAWLRQNHRVRRLGVSRIHDHAELFLGLGRRCTTERLALHRILSRSRPAEEAFLAGRLTSCQILALGPVLQRQDARRWIQEAVRLSVRELRRKVRAARRLQDPPSGEEMREVAFPAPACFLAVWNEAMEISRRVLGYEAPQWACVEAILAEAGMAAGGEKQEDPAPREGRMRTQAPDKKPIRGGALPVSPEALSQAMATLSEMRACRDDLDTLLEAGPPRDPFEAHDRLLRIQALEAPLEILFARMLRALRDTRTPERLGYRGLFAFLQDHLGLSERTARNRIALCHLFEDLPGLEKAYGTRRVGLLKVHLIRRVATPRLLEAWIGRAEEITVRQLASEVRFLRLLAKTDPSLARRFRGPFPLPDLEVALLQELQLRGWTRARVNRELRGRGIVPPRPGACGDPAVNRVLMDRLEALLDLNLTNLWDELFPDPAEGFPPEIRQSFAHPAAAGRIRLRLPETLACDLEAAIGEIRGLLAPPASSWMALTLLFARAIPAWLEQDPSRRPRHARIFRRDRYRCQAPACGQRRDLHGHHLIYLSCGGTNAPANRTTLCCGDHVGVIHAGFARVSGEAPHDLLWELGVRAGSPPLLALKGAKIVGRG